MTVAEMISELHKYPGDMRVFYEGYYDNYEAEIDGIEDYDREKVLMLR